MVSGSTILSRGTGSVKVRRWSVRKPSSARAIAVKLESRRRRR